MTTCLLCGTQNCSEHTRSELPERSEDEKLVALWHQFKELVLNQHLPQNATLVLYADGSGGFSHTQKTPKGLIEVEHGTLYDLEGSIDSTKHFRVWKHIRSYTRETTDAGLLCAELHAWRRASAVPDPKHIIMWNNGLNLTVWLEENPTPFVFKGESNQDIDQARKTLRTWLCQKS